jgi:hypothetical protein
VDSRGPSNVELYPHVHLHDDTAHAKCEVHPMLRRLRISFPVWHVVAIVQAHLTETPTFRRPQEDS